MVSYLARFKKALSALVGAVVAAGGVDTLFPDLPAGVAAGVGGVVALLAVLLGPKNKDKPVV